MQEPFLSRCMSGVDAAFLYLESKELPLPVAAVAILEEAIPHREFVANIDSKLHLMPRYRQKVVEAPHNVGHPTWEPDPEFDLRRHIFAVRLDPPGGEAELEALISRIVSQRFDRGKPLWDIHVVDGLKGGRGALIQRWHHALVDGVSAAGLLGLVLDPTRDGSVRARKPRRPTRPSAPAPRSIREVIGDVLQGTFDNLLQAQSGLVDVVTAFTGGKESKGITSILPELLAPVERLPFNKRCGEHRKFCWAEMPLATLQAVRASAGGTLNDIVLTVLTRALARYVKLHGETTANRLVRIVCPVSLRNGEQGNSLGNRLTFMPVVLPMDIRDPVQHLRAVIARVEIMKNAKAAELVGLLGNCIGAAPPTMQKLFWSTIARVTLPVPLFNIICTNVPGSPAPLYAMGRRMLACYPHVPTGYDLGVGCAVHSYNGTLFYGLTADADVAPDVTRLRDFLYSAFRELCRSAGVKYVRRPVAAPRRARAASAKKPRAAHQEPAEKPAPAKPVTAVASDPEPAPAAMAAAAG